jgi:hypothetical protein
MPASVESQYLKMRKQIRNLWRPHGMIGSNGMGKNKHGFSRCPFYPIKQARIVAVSKRQFL